MGTENKNLVTISYVTDSEVGYYKIGEIEGSFDKEQLKNYIERFGHNELCSQLAYLQYQVWNALQEVNYEKEKNSVYENGINCTGKE